MHDSTLSQLYDPEAFRDLGHQLIDLLADHLDRVQNDPKAPVIDYKSPADELAYWQADFQKENTSGIQLFEKILRGSTSVHHPKYMGHQVSVPAYSGALAGLMTDLLSNGTGVYDMGMASNALERLLTDFLAKYFGFGEQAAGFFTSGGTLANLTALLAARKAKSPTDVWEEGHAEELAVLVSEEAHYCIDRAARIMGLGASGIIKVPVDDQFKIRTDLLENYYNQATQSGKKVIALIGCAGSTATGSYDDLEALADFCAAKDLWFHVDGAHGASVVFSEQHRPLVKGIERADTVVLDFHKMLLTPSLNTALVFRDGKVSYQTFQQRAQYLWELEQSMEWYESGKRTFECTKFMMSIKAYAVLKLHGKEVFGKNVDQLFASTQAFAKLVQQDPDFELAIMPEANILNFRYIDLPADVQDQMNARIRQMLVQSGRFYFVQTVIKGQRFLRTAIMNPLTTTADFKALLDEVRTLAKTLTSVAN